MSILRYDTIKNRAGTGAPDFPNGATVTGVVTATTFKGEQRLLVELLLPQVELLVVMFRLVVYYHTKT